MRNFLYKIKIYSIIRKKEKSKGQDEKLVRQKGKNNIQDNKLV